MSRMVVVSALEPDARGTGKTVMWSGLWRHLVRRHGDEGATYVLVRREPPTIAECKAWSNVDGIPLTIVGVRSPSGREQAVNLAVALRRGRPFQEATLGGRRVHGALRDAVRTSGADVVLVDTYRLGVHLVGLQGTWTTVLYLEDLFSIRYERMLEATLRWPDVLLEPLGNFGALLPSWVRAVVARPFWTRRLLASEARRVRRTEIEAPQVFDHTVLLNGDEAAQLRAWSGSDAVVALPPRVDVGHAVERRASASDPNYVFLGAMNVPHNDVGLTVFLKDVLPLLLEAQPSARVVVVGRGVSEGLRSAAARFGERIHFAGFVDDLDDVLARATALIAPLVFGSGLKIKVLEALGRGIPVVATSFGAEGLTREIHGDDGLFVADAWPAFVAAASALVDPETNRAASAAARRNFLRHYGPDVVDRAYDLLI